MSRHAWLLWILLPALMTAAAGEAVYYTNHEDRYYHADENCDRPPEKNWWDGSPTAFFEREIYQKYEISEAAALAFEKAACPVCADVFEPVYLGRHMPEWPCEVQPWEISGLTEEQESAFLDARPQAFIDEIAATAEAFNAYYEETWDHSADQVVRKHEYPAFFAGKYMNNAGCVSYAVVSPTGEILDAFKALFGGGAWIVPAKYGYDEIMDESSRVFTELKLWCAAHPELDIRSFSAGGPDYTNCAVIGISGADWAQAAAAMEETAPVYIHFRQEEPMELL